MAARILIVEDEGIIAAQMQRWLKWQGHTVVGQAATGVEAIAQALRLQPELVLMDIQLRDKVTGIEAAAALRAQADMAIIYLSGNTDTATIQQAQATYPCKYLVKPVDERELAETLVEVLECHRARQRRWCSKSPM
jgi:YesN/AraC family two-component response regulator